MALRRAVGEGRLESKAPGEARVDLVFDDGTTYPQPGRLLFANASVDPGTGQITLRAEFPNTNGELLPGMYVRVRIEQAVRQNALTVPQRAVTRNETGQAQIYVIEGDTAKLRNVTLGQALGSEWVVESGLNGGDVIIVDGVQKAQPDLKVVPEPWTAPEESRNATTPAAE
ncbi:Multidrug resistance protein MexA precursor [compost metagenome]